MPLGLGNLTIEDLIEEVVGEIVSELGTERRFILRQTERELLVDAELVRLRGTPAPVQP